MVLWADVMQAIPGRVVANMEVTTEFRANICVSVNQALADLHSVDYKAVGLDGTDNSPSGPYGKVDPVGNPGGYTARQLRTWGRNCAPPSPAPPATP